MALALDIEVGSPNLDAMTDIELGAFRENVGCRPHVVAGALFPSESEYRARFAVRLLADYAAFISDARAHRLAGRISLALQNEGYAERVYGMLPGFARW